MRHLNDPVLPLLLGRRAAAWQSMLAAAVLIAPGSAAAVAGSKPTAAEVAAARSECFEHRLRVDRLQADPRISPETLAQERSAWDRVCAHAESLMEAAGIKEPSPPPHAPPPPAEIRIVERIALPPGTPRRDAAAQTQPAAQPAAAGARRKEN